MQKRLWEEETDKEEHRERLCDDHWRERNVREDPEVHKEIGKDTKTSIDTMPSRRNSYRDWQGNNMVTVL